MPGAEWILAAYIGSAHTLSESLRVTQPAAGTVLTLSDVDYEGRSFTPPLYYGYRLSVFPRAATFGVEAEFIHMKAYARTERATSKGLVLLQIPGCHRKSFRNELALPTAFFRPFTDLSTAI